jgi:hypothetical protein
MDDVQIDAGPFKFGARWEIELAPLTCKAFRARLPFLSSVIHVRWSGEAAWIPLGQFELSVPQESALHTPPPGATLFYPHGISETEILIPYGVTRFASVAGPLAGNHFLTITRGLEQLTAFGQHLLWEGALPIAISAR